MVTPLLRVGKHRLRPDWAIDITERWSPASDSNLFDADWPDPVEVDAVKGVKIPPGKRIWIALKPPSFSHVYHDAEQLTAAIQISLPKGDANYQAFIVEGSDGTNYSTVIGFYPSRGGDGYPQLVFNFLKQGKQTVCALASEPVDKTNPDDLRWYFFSLNFKTGIMKFAENRKITNPVIGWISDNDGTNPVPNPTIADIELPLREFTGLVPFDIKIAAGDHELWGRKARLYVDHTIEEVVEDILGN